jgi:hypothetical protein
MRTTKRMSRRCSLLFGLVVAAGVMLLMQAISGLVLWLALPRGAGGGERGLSVGLKSLGHGVEQTFAGIERSTWVTIHDWAAVLFVTVVILHAAMHWKWIVRQSRAVLGGRPAANAGAS